MMYVNGQQVLQGGAKVVPKDFSFSPGDVITVMAIGRATAAKASAARSV